MKNYIQDGDTITVIAAADVASGVGHLVGSIFGIAVVTAVSGDPVSLKRTGVVEHAKTSAQAWTQGVKIYWDNSNKVFTSSASGNTLVGMAAEAAANPSDTGKVLLTGQAV